MASAQLMLEVALLLLLAATLFHALRLEKALGVLKRDRAVLEELVEGFNESTRQAESGIERLRTAADGAGRQISRQIETAGHLRDDLSFLADRSDRLAARLEAAVRGARMFADSAALPPAAAPGLAPSIVPGAGGAAVASDRSETTRRQHAAAPAAAVLAPSLEEVGTGDEPDGQPRLRSQAERDLMRALRGRN